MADDRILLFAQDDVRARALAKALDAEIEAVPDSSSDPAVLEAWREGALAGAPRSKLVVYLGAVTHEPRPLMELDESVWSARFERPYLAWNLALGAASKRVADSGALVAVVQTPSALDSAGWVPEASIADGVIALVRSIAAAEGGRGVRANLVTTPTGLVEPPVIAPQPPLACFPGGLDREVAGAVRLLLSTDAGGITGRSVPADGGRTLV